MKIDVLMFSSEIMYDIYADKASFILGKFVNFGVFLRRYIILKPIYWE